MIKITTLFFLWASCLSAFGQDVAPTKPDNSRYAAQNTEELIAKAKQMNNWELRYEVNKAITNNVSLAERKKWAGIVKLYLKYNNVGEQIIEQSYIGDLLKDSDNPEDVLEAVTAYDYFLRNTKKYGYNLPHDYPDQEASLSLLLISKYYYYWKTGELPMDAHFTLAEAVRWFEGSLKNNLGYYKEEKTWLTDFENRLSALQKLKVLENNPQAYSETMDIIKRYSGIFLCRMGDVSKYNWKKQAKQYYLNAIGLGNADAKNNLAKIDEKPAGGYGAFDYRNIHVNTFPQEYADRMKAANTPSQKETEAYNEWWNKTYGKGGTQNSSPMPNNNTPQASYKPAAQSESDRHQSAMDQIYRDTYKQMEKNFKKN